MKRWALAMVVVCVCAAPLPAAEDDAQLIQLRDLHLCCPQCVAALETALASVPGISEIKFDRKNGSAQFRFVEQADMELALEASNRAGFHGKAFRLGKEVTPADPPLDDNLVEDQVLFRGVHLCCKGCARAVADALKPIPEVVSVDCHIKNRTVILTGNAIPVAEARKRIFAAGFHACYVPVRVARKP